MIEYFANNVKKRYRLSLLCVLCSAGVFFIMKYAGTSAIGFTCLWFAFFLGVINFLIAVIQVIQVLLCLGFNKCWKDRTLSPKQVDRSIFESEKVQLYAENGNPVRCYKIFFMKRYIMEVK